MPHPTPPAWLTTAQAAPLWGMTPAQLRRAAAAGDIPGATPLGAPGTPWRFDPAHAPGAPTMERAPAAHKRQGPDRLAAHQPHRPPNLMSPPRHDAGDTLARTLEVSDRLRGVTARPAVALSGVLSILTHAAARHYAGRDGWCPACSWQYPCPDAQAAARALELAHRVVITGARDA
jgi:hypothetical protein